MPLILTLFDPIIFLSAHSLRSNKIAIFKDISMKYFNIKLTRMHIWLDPVCTHNTRPSSLEKRSSRKNYARLSVTTDAYLLGPPAAITTATAF